jgi:hypothetical protein
MLRRLRIFVKQAAISPAAPDPGEDCAEVTRAAAVERQPRQGARHVGNAAERQPKRLRQGVVADQVRNAVEPRVDPDRIGQGRHQPLGELAPAAPVTVRSIALIRLPCRSPESVRASSRLARVAGSMNNREPSRSCSGRPSGGRSEIWVFST